MNALAPLFSPSGGDTLRSREWGHEVIRASNRPHRLAFGEPPPPAGEDANRRWCSVPGLLSRSLSGEDVESAAADETGEGVPEEPSPVHDFVVYTLSHRRRERV